jgi:transcriptional regulator with XRE-family HTH domain
MVATTSSSVGERIRSLRRRHGLTQRQLAERAGLSLEGVYTVEAGRKRPRATTIQLLAAALDVRPSDLLPLAQ